MSEQLRKTVPNETQPELPPFTALVHQRILEKIAQAPEHLQDTLLKKYTGSQLDMLDLIDDEIKNETLEIDAVELPSQSTESSGNTHMHGMPSQLMHGLAPIFADNSLTHPPRPASLPDVASTQEMTAIKVYQELGDDGETQEYYPLYEEEEEKKLEWDGSSMILSVPRYGSTIHVSLLEVWREKGKVKAIVKTGGLSTRSDDDADFRMKLIVGDRVVLEDNTILEYSEHFAQEGLVQSLVSREYLFDASVPDLVPYERYKGHGF